MLRNLPNALCIARMLLAVPVAVLLLSKEYTATLWVFAVAAISDGLDGFLAKRFNWTSELGKILDPLADKILLVTAFLSLTAAELLPLWLAVTVVLRDVIITAGAIAYRYVYGPLTDAKPTLISKLNTLLQIVLVLLVVGASVLEVSWKVPTAVLATMVMVSTIASGVDYVATYTQRAIANSRAQRG
jgi:cardiolipin synthase (CMP-forming)